MSKYNWPEDAVNADYAKIVLNAIAIGDAEYSFSFITSEWKGHKAKFRVLDKPVKIDGFYPGAGGRLAQQVADLLGCIFQTGKISDLRYKQAVTKIPPIFYDAMRDKNGNGLPAYTNPDGSRGAPADMTKVYVMRLYAQYLDAAAEKAGYRGGVLSDCGKPWIIDNQLAATPTMAENYGFYQKEQPSAGHVPVMQIFEPGSLPGVAVVQGYWFPPAHSAAQDDSYGGDQADYSETLSGFVHRTCEVDGKERDIIEVLGDPDLCGLGTVNGQPLKVFRQPNVPVYACQTKTLADRMLTASTSTDPETCPLPPAPPTGNNTGGASPAVKVAIVVATVAAAGGIGYATRRYWLPPLRRAYRAFT